MSTKKEDLPTIQLELKKGIEKPQPLSHVETEEKNSLPDQEAIEKEKEHNALKEGIEKFPVKELKKVEVEVKNPLPDQEAIEKEKEHNALKDGIENFPVKELKKVEVDEKNPLPTKEQIEAEKKAKK